MQAIDHDQKGWASTAYRCASSESARVLDDGSRPNMYGIVRSRRIVSTTMKTCALGLACIRLTVGKSC